MLELTIDESPQRVALKNDLMCTVRPLREEDEVALSDFIIRLAPNDHLFIKGPLSDIDLIMNRCRSGDHGWNWPLLALEGGRVVAIGTVHQIENGWKRHLGSLGVLIDPDHRNHGLVHLLIRSLVQEAKHLGMIRLESELMRSSPKYDAFRDAGFDELSRVQDRLEIEPGHRQFHDHVLLGISLGTDAGFAEARN